jgi:DNA polymerase elongation subunit (family B)
MISQEEIKSFLEGNDPEEHIVAIEFDYVTDSIYKIKEIPGTGKVIKKDTFTAFAWVGDLRGLKFYDTSKDLQKQAMTKYGIVIDKLETKGDERLENGLKFLVKSLKGYRSLIQFFRDGGIDPWSERVKDKIMVLPPVEQYLIQREKRLFKGYEEYNDITRFVFDLETTALEPKDGRIFMIGVKTNKGFKKVIECANEDDERKGIVEFFKIIDEIKPSIIGGYNSFNFDWFWIYERCKALNIDIKRVCKSLNPQRTISQKDGMLKLANEVERYTQTSIWGYNVIDIIHSVRRAQAINSSIKSAGLKYITQYIEAEAADRVYIPHEEIGSMYAKKEEYWLNLQNGKYKRANKPEFDNLDVRFPNVYVKTTGDDIVERYLDDDLEETLAVDEEFNQGTFLLASMVPTTYERVSTMGTATLWKMIMLAWSYKHKLAIPQKESKTEFVGGLSRLLKVGYSRNVLKLDYSSLYPSIQLVHDVFPKCDVLGGMKAMLTYFRTERIKNKNLTLEWKSKDKKVSQKYDRLQLPLKIFINSLFGALSAPQVFAWGDMNCGEMITCTGRQYLRQMVKFFTKKGYTASVLDTDGCNFLLPKGVEERKYVGRGINPQIKKDKEYTSFDADVAEFNENFMKSPMFLDCDGTWISCINLSRKNYATLEHNGKIKLTGNSIKSKKLPLYIEDFLDVAIKLLLEGEGQKFIEWYYEYLTRIFNKDIPLVKIAQRAKVKLNIDDYIKRSKQTTKSGSLMSRQAHMELAIHHKLNVQLGDIIYYVNNGTRASHGDVQKVNRPKAGWNDEQIKLFFSDSKISKTSFKEKEEFLLKNGWEQSWSDNNWVRSNSKNKEANTGIPTDVAYRLASTDSVIQLNCYRIDPSDLENNPDMKGDYNVPRAITTFNKRIEPLLIVFKEEIRESLLVTDPEQRAFFTKEQCELINGVPFKEGDQDSLENLLTITPEELKFWERKDMSPNHIYDFAEPGWEKYI